MTKIEDEIVADLPLSPRGRLAQNKIASNRLMMSRSQRLSEIEPNNGLVFPHKYTTLYENMKKRDPIAAKKFYNQCLYDPRPKPVDKHKLARTMLERQGKDNTLKRRV